MSDQVVENQNQKAPLITEQEPVEEENKNGFFKNHWWKILIILVVGTVVGLFFGLGF